MPCESDTSVPDHSRLGVGPNISSSQLASTVKDDVGRTHLPGYSFRIGAASTAAPRGLEDSTIQTLGRWKRTSGTSGSTQKRSPRLETIRAV